ncbi:hypothetical protein [Tropicimonas sp. IMCC6043]|uniref:hypothetical protein n=1 Tax=Tropicimonas sp. IMCC6043 TaxID=2510645 RepID=UPI00101B692B|nr:hypothetical protein [Tropicimonas sp. IMCC6043]RYH07775.1 hypothetical protein EU800_18795 [Tropicimonas sp. IMCC6043]
MAQKNEFQAMIMPTDFRRRWSYDALIPSLLYFDSVSFLNDDVRSAADLVDPTTMTGCGPKDVVEGLLVEQHRYYWPFREILSEGVISLCPIEIQFHIFSPPPPPPGIKVPVKSPRGWRSIIDERLTQGDEVAKSFVAIGARYFDLVGEKDQSMEDIDKALWVAAWTKDALRYRARGQKRVAIHPDGQTAMELSIALFNDVEELVSKRTEARLDWQNVPPDRGKKDGFGDLVGLGLITKVLEKILPTFSIDGDPSRLSEILEVRHQRADELRVFRQFVMEAEEKFAVADVQEREDAAREFILESNQLFEDLEKALSDPNRKLKLRASKFGGVLIAGISGAVGGAIAALNPAAGTVLGEAVAGATEGTISHMLDKASDSLETREVHPGLSYLFYAKEAMAGQPA